MNEEDFIKELIRNKQKRVQHFPDKQKARYFIEELFDLLFVRTTAGEMGINTKEKYGRLKITFTELVAVSGQDDDAVRKQTAIFFEQLPLLYQFATQDAQYILDSDPAAKSIEEVLSAYPGFFATVVYRFSHQLFQQGFTMLPRFFTEYAHSKTGIDIHPGAKIGCPFAIDHGTGVVIGETSVIGNHVKIYQGVTLGALNVSKDKASIKRHPTIEDNVIIYSGATILGGDTVIGSGTIIGGNVWLTYSVPSNSVVYHKSEIRVKDNNPFPEPLNFVI